MNLFSRNEDLVKSIRNKLTKFHNELKDLRNALNEAENNTAHAMETNNINEKRLEDILVRDTDQQFTRLYSADKVQFHKVLHRFYSDLHAVGVCVALVHFRYSLAKSSGSAEPEEDGG